MDILHGVRGHLLLIFSYISVFLRLLSYIMAIIVIIIRALHVKSLDENASETNDSMGSPNRMAMWVANGQRMDDV